MSPCLGVNIDHVGTLRQARYALMPDAHNVEPDMVAAAAVCEQAGAKGITVHLRTDRRHLQDRDLHLLKHSVRTKLNLEMSNTPEILAIALEVHPADVCIVPENRQEITTEGGLDAKGLRGELEGTIKQLSAAGIQVSLFIDPDVDQVQASVELGAPVVELHTGTYANAASPDERRAELERLHAAAEAAYAAGLQVNAGHGLNYHNVPRLLTHVPHLRELNIGHSIVSRAIYVGLERAVGEMLLLVK